MKLNKAIKVISFDAYDTILSSKSNLEEISDILFKDTKPKTINSFWIEFSKAMDLEFEQIEKFPFQKVSFLYKNALNDKNLKKFLKVSIDIATEIIYNSHANAVAIEGIQDLIQSLRKEYIVVILSDADNDFLISALKKNNIIVDLVVTSEMAKGYKRNVNSNVFNHFLSQNNYSPDSIIHIGDSINDKIGCEKYGINFLYFNPFNRPSSINNINAVNSLSEIYDLFLE